MKGSFDHALTCQTRAPDISGFHFIFLDDILINLNGRLYYNFLFGGEGVRRSREVPLQTILLDHLFRKQNLLFSKYHGP
jgi:hypothetical protein